MVSVYAVLGPQAGGLRDTRPILRRAHLDSGAGALTGLRAVALGLGG
jgi:hypothetical protein